MQVKEKYKKLKKEVKGITLIALVITIIVLLILAGITISLTLGENGILRRSEEGKIVHEQADILEQARLNVAEKQLTRENKQQYIEFFKTKEIITNETKNVDGETYYKVNVTKLIQSPSTGLGNFDDGDVYYISNGELYYISTKAEEKYIGKIFIEEVPEETPEDYFVMEDDGLRLKVSRGYYEWKAGFSDDEVSGALGLDKIVVPSTWNGVVVNKLGGDGFRGNGLSCSDVKEIVVPGCVKTIGNWCFGYCESLRSVKFEDGVETLGDSCFSNCSSLESVVIPGSVTTIGTRAFYHCTSLEEISIPNGVETLGYQCFNGCSALKEVTIPASVQSLEYLFSSCPAMERVKVGWLKGEKPTGWKENTFNKWYGDFHGTIVYADGTEEQV